MRGIAEVCITARGLGVWSPREIIAFMPYKVVSEAILDYILKQVCHHCSYNICSVKPLYSNILSNPTILHMRYSLLTKVC